MQTLTHDHLTAGPTRVVLADCIAVHAAALGPTWNGWESPYFTRPEAEALVLALRAMADAQPDAEWEVLRWEGDILTRHAPAYDAGEYADPARPGDTVDPDGLIWRPFAAPAMLDDEQVWNIGGWEWTWSTLSEDAVLMWSVSRFSGNPIAAFYAPGTTESTGDRLFPTREAAAEYARTPQPVCGIVSAEHPDRSCILGPNHAPLSHSFRKATH